MPDDAEREKKEKGFVVYLFTWVAWVFVAVALYVLSVGPVLKFLYRSGQTPGPVVERFYAPLFWVCVHSELADSIRDAYLVKVWRIEQVRVSVSP